MTSPCFASILFLQLFKRHVLLCKTSVFILENHCLFGNACYNYVIYAFSMHAVSIGESHMYDNFSHQSIWNPTQYVTVSLDVTSPKLRDAQWHNGYDVCRSYPILPPQLNPSLGVLYNKTICLSIMWHFNIQSLLCLLYCHLKECQSEHRRTQVSNVWWMPNSSSKGFCPALRTGLSRWFQRSNNDTPQSKCEVLSQLLILAHPL